MHLSSKLNILRFPWCPFLHPPPPRPLLISLRVSFSFFFSTCTEVSRPAQDKFCLHQDGGGGRRARTKDAFIAVGSGWLRTDNGHILQVLKQIAVCSLPC